MVIFTEHLFPLVITTSIGEPDEETFETYFRRFRDYKARGERFVTLSDARAGAVPNAYWRRRFAEMSNDIEQIAGDLNVAAAAVLRSKLMVGAARAVAWMRRGEDTVYYATTASDALAFLEGEAANHSVKIPERAGRFVAQLDRLFDEGADPTSFLERAAR